MTASTTTSSLNIIYRDIRSDLENVEAHLKQIGRSSNPLIAEVNKYLFRKGGKRIRPAVLILAAKLCDYQGQDHIFWSALVEIIHTASLIHDDIVDNSIVRRGQETVHAKWGPNITVLLGDFLYIQSIALALRTKHHSIIDIMADVTAKMIEGELIEYSMTGQSDMGENVYFEILGLKTAALFAASSRIGAVLAGAAPEDERRLEAFGENLGLAFQIVDDVLDFAGDEATLGKPVLTDVREGRITLPLIHALGRAKGPIRRELIGLIGRRTKDRSAPMKIREHVAAAGGLDSAFKRAAEYSRKAAEILSSFPSSPARESLERLTALVLERRA